MLLGLGHGPWPVASRHGRRFGTSSMSRTVCTYRPRRWPLRDSQLLHVPAAGALRPAVTYFPAAARPGEGKPNRQGKLLGAARNLPRLASYHARLGGVRPTGRSRLQHQQVPVRGCATCRAVACGVGGTCRDTWGRDTWSRTAPRREGARTHAAEGQPPPPPATVLHVSAAYPTAHARARAPLCFFSRPRRVMQGVGDGPSAARAHV